MSLTPTYASDQLNPAYHLRYTWTGWATGIALVASVFSLNQVQADQPLIAPEDFPKYRTWRDASGKHEIEAKFVRKTD